MRAAKNERENRWTLADQVAFECALAKDEDEEWQTLKRRDRALAAEAGLWELPGRRAIAKRWLAERLKGDASIRRAAEGLSHSLTLAGWALAVAGFAFGVCLASAALAYTGEQPVNVSAFFLVFVLLQALFACLLLIPFLLPGAWKGRIAFGPLFRLAYWLFHFAFAKAQSLASRFLAGAQRQESAEIAAAARRQLGLHRQIVKWLAFRALQGAALFFNMGALLALLAAVAFSDRAFGWQTTLEVSPETAQSIARFFSTPWAWVYGEGGGFPNQEQIEESRIRLMERPDASDPASFAAWWRFLALGILCYGLLPRLALYALGSLQTRKALDGYDFRNAAAERLFARLAPDSPRFVAQEIAGAAREDSPRPALAIRPPASSGQKIACYYSEALTEVFDLAGLKEQLAARWNVPEENVAMAPHRETSFPKASESAIEEWQFALLFESWMPPIKEIERQIRSLRAKVDQRSLIRIVLLGVPDSNGQAVSLAPERKYARAWDAFARKLGDPYIMIDNPA